MLTLNPSSPPLDMIPSRESSSSAPNPKPRKRLNPTSPPSDLVPPSPAKKSRPNSPEKDDSQMSDVVLAVVKDGSGISDALLAELGCTCEYLLLTSRERAEMTIKAILAREEARGEVTVGLLTAVVGTNRGTLIGVLPYKEGLIGFSLHNYISNY